MITCNLLVIKTPQQETTYQFYQQLGMAFEKHRHGKGLLHYSTELPPMVFEIYPLPPSQTSADTSTRLGFVLPNLEAVITQLPAEYIIRPPHHSEWGYQALIRDPDGRKIEITQR